MGTADGGNAEGSSSKQVAILVVGLIVAFAVGFLIIRALPLWAGLPLLIVLVVGARLYRIRTAGTD